MVYTCAQCGVVFDAPRSQRRIYCSRSCASQVNHNLARKKRTRVICAWCGVEALRYPTGHPSTRYCSDTCGDAAYNAGRPLKRQAPTVLLTCACCGRTVEIPAAGASKRKFCSHACNVKAHSGYVPQAALTCAWCKEEFRAHARGGYRKYCGRECRLAGQRQERIAFRIAHPKPPNPHRYATIRGPNCHLWKGGVTPENKRLRSSPAYKAWRLAVWRRDLFTCQRCGIKGNGKVLVAHHIKSWRAHPELRFELSNGQTLCRSCHNVVDERLRLRKIVTGKRHRPAAQMRLPL